MEELRPEDSDGGELARQGRVVEMLSEHTLVGMLEGYLLTGNKSGDVVRVYLPADANCLLAVAEEALVEPNVCNLIVSDKQEHLQYLSLDQARSHVAKGIGPWSWASNDHSNGQPDEPDVVMAYAGDIPTQETLAAVEILRQELPELRVRVLNVVKLFALTQPSEHPHGLSDRDFDTLFTTDRPVLFNFHGYPWLIHRLTYRRRNHANFHVRGYKEKGNINTPLELAMNNQIDRFSLVIDVIDRVPGLRSRAAHIKEQMKESILANRAYAHEHGMDAPEISNWQWSTAVQTELA